MRAVKSHSKEVLRRLIMKNLSVILMVWIMFTSCKNDTKSNAVDAQTTTVESTVELTGNFMYYDDVAVFQTSTDLYGVHQNLLIEIISNVKNK